MLGFGRAFPADRTQTRFNLTVWQKIFGMADALVVNDPITGQGSNNAAKCSKIYFDAILANDNQALANNGWFKLLNAIGLMQKSRGLDQ